MSLGGLDAPEVNEAYQAALTEAGGWFLLKYVSRDEVEILGRGTGGFPEASATVAQYSDKSPLYGFLVYRRRKVIVKYVPEGTSRVLLARTTVHFQAVIDRFSPHDAIFNATSSTDFTEAAISSTCSLHTVNSFRLSSGGSGSRQGLGEITEDVEEPTTTDKIDNTTTPMTFDAMEAMAMSSFNTYPSLNGITLDLQEASYVTGARDENSQYLNVSHKTKVSPGISPMDEKENSPFHGSSSAPQLPEVNVSSFQLTMDRMPSPQTPLRDEAVNGYVDVPRSPTAESHNLYEFASRASTERPEPSISSRPGTSDTYTPSFLGGRTKKKLFPRPAEQIPEKANSFRQKLPAGIRMAFHRKDDDRPKASKSRRYKSEKAGQDPPLTADVLSSKLNGHGLDPSPSKLQSSTQLQNGPAIVRPQSTITSGTSELQRNIPLENAASGGVEEPLQKPKLSSEENSEPFPSFDTTSGTKPRKMTPEKERLMKALQLRNQQIRARAFAQDISGLNSPLVTVEENKASSFGNDGPLDPSTKVDSGVDLDYVKESKTNGNHVQTDDGFSGPETPKTKGIPLPFPSTPPHKASENLTSAETEVKTPKAHSPAKQEQAPQASKETVLSKVESKAQQAMTTENVKQAARKEKRRGVVDPLTVEIPIVTSDDEYMSDDSLIHELQSAKVQEAKPVPVPKASGISTPFDASGQRRPSAASVTSVIIKGSSRNSPVAVRTEPRPPIGLSRPESIGIANRGNVSSGISRRIKALAEISNREVISYNTGNLDNASSYVGRNQSLNSLARPPSFVPSAMTEMAPTSPRLQFSMLSPQSPKYRPSDSVSLYSQYGRQPENVSVTARIVRDPRSNNLLGHRMPLEEEEFSLHQSPLIVDQHPPGHRRSISRDAPPPVSAPSILSSHRPTSRESNITAITAVTRKSRESTWRSMGRRKHESKTVPPAARSVTSFHQTESLIEKRQSISSRFYNRMSGLSGSKYRKNSMESSAEQELNIVAPGPPPPVVVGDLNVQFPDSLLWRRRWVEVDPLGNLILSVSKTNEAPHGLVKKFNLSEFKPPRVPAPERQELPNSVIFDHISGSTLQLACEDVISQNQVFRRLKDIHRAWMMYEK